MITKLVMSSIFKRLIIATKFPLVVLMAACAILCHTGGCSGGGTRSTADLRLAGIIVDTQSLPIEGVLILDLGTEESTLTDQNGEFLLEVRAGISGPLLQISKGPVVVPLVIPELAGAAAASVVVELDVDDEKARAVDVVVTESNTPVPVPTILPTESPVNTVSPNPTIAPIPTNTPRGSDSNATPTVPPTFTPTSPVAPPSNEATPTSLPTHTPMSTPTPIAGFSPGDMNCDGVVNGDDYEPFVLALVSPDQYQQAFPNCDISLGDVNGDGQFNFDDIDAFLNLIG